MATPEQAEVAAMPFAESAKVAAEVIRTLIDTRTVAPNDVAPGLISAAVAGPEAERRWQQTGACAAGQISQAHRDMIARALPQLAHARSAQRLPKGPAARLVQVIDFGPP